MIDRDLNSRIKQLRLEADKTQKDFANDLNITQGNLSLIESGKTSVTLETLKLLKKKYKKSYDWLIDGKKDLKDSDELIPLVDKAALAGYPAGHGTEDYENSLSLYKIPGFENGEFKIFEVEGDSMVPTLLPHDYVITVKLENYANIVDGSLCVVITEEEVLAKRVYKEQKRSFRLESDNPRYQPITYRQGDIQEIWGVQAKITQSFMMPDGAGQRSIEALQQDMNSLKEEIEKLKNGRA